MNWIERNLKTIIYIAFLVPIITVAIVSISHVAIWYGLSNPVNWALYLSVGIEIAALSALAAISVQMGSKVYLPFGVVTLIQFIGNIFFSYQFIQIDSKVFLDWVDLVSPLLVFIGIEGDNLLAHKRFLALFSGGMLPIISLSFLHMLVKFEEEEKKKRLNKITTDVPNNNNVEKEIIDLNSISDNVDLDKMSTDIGIEESKIDQERFIPTEDDLTNIQNQLEKINEIKFGSPKNQVSDDDTIIKNIVETKDNEDNSYQENQVKPDELDTEYNPDILEEEYDEPKVRRLSYLKRDV